LTITSSLRGPSSSSEDGVDFGDAAAAAAAAADELDGNVADGAADGLDDGAAAADAFSASFLLARMRSAFSQDMSCEVLELFGFRRMCKV
jgi:hypothetical protein